MPLKKYFSSCLKFDNQQTAITKLDFSNTQLGENFPDVWQHERTLEELHLSSARLNSLPPQLFYCHSLRILAVNNNNLEEIPPAIASLRQLQRLDFSRNLLSTIPLNIKACKNLTHMDLSCNHLQRLPDAITCLISLQELFLNETSLEYMPANFGRLLNLRILELRLNNLINLPKSMARLCNLQRLDIGGNDFSELPSVIGELKNLQELWIDFNQIRSDDWPNVSKLKELRHFEANNNQIDTLVPEISNWRNIEVISICKCNLNSLPFGVGTLKTLVTLKCESNALQELPDSIAHLENLEELVLSHNELTRLPKTIGMLHRLRFLFADNNCLQMLPDELCNCQQLSVLSLSRNLLRELPRNIGHLSKLKVLNIVHNRISSLPVSILNLKSLTSLWISDNQSQPLVPLQYIDGDVRSQLTCFMLPQVPYNVNQPLPANSYYQPNMECNQAVMPQLIQSVETTMPLPSNQSPNRRIYFAEETTILPAAVAALDQNNVTCGNVMPDNINTEYYRAIGNSNDMSLMRSPTPYPKELRAMAKYVRNGQLAAGKTPVAPLKEQFTTSNESKQICFPIKIAERRINQTQLHQQQQQPQQQQQAHVENGGEVECQLETINANIYHNNTNDVSNYNIYAPTANSINNINDNLMQQQQHNSNNNNNDDESINISHQIEENSINSSQQQQQQQYLLNQQQPPPYHLARAFSKKTAEDMCHYEILRQQQQHQQQQQHHEEQKELQRLNAPELETELIEHHEQNNLQNQQQQPSNTYVMSTIQKFSTPTTQDVALTANSIKNHEHQINNINNNNNNNSAPNMGVGSVSKDGFYGTIPRTTTPTNTLKKTSWLFGVHKNPTVKQIALKWEGHIGFDVTEIKDDNGTRRSIIVSSVIPNTPAANLLCINDKLLEIDGVDLSSLSHNQIKGILRNAAPIINIMLSRV